VQISVSWWTEFFFNTVRRQRSQSFNAQDHQDVGILCVVVVVVVDVDPRCCFEQWQIDLQLNNSHLEAPFLGFMFKVVQHNKQYHMKLLLNSFHLNGHTLRFHPQT